MGGYLTACDFGKDIDNVAEIFGKNISADFFLEAVNDTGKRLAGTNEDIIVTGIGDYDVGVVQSGYITSLEDSLFKQVNVLMMLGGDSDKRMLLLFKERWESEVLSEIFIYLVLYDNQLFVF